MMYDLMEHEECVRERAVVRRVPFYVPLQCDDPCMHLCTRHQRKCMVERVQSILKGTGFLEPATMQLYDFSVCFARRIHNMLYSYNVYTI